MDDNARLSVIEALILASPEPLPARKVAEMVEGVTPAGAGQAVAQLNNRYMEAGCSFRLREVAGGYQMYVVPEFAGYVQEMFSRRRKMRLTRASLETLAIVAYRQPVTKSEIEHVRGVASDGVVHNLLQKKLVTIRGRAKTVGKPLQYGTTDEFLKFFGLASLADLPKMSEIEELIAAEESANQTQLELAQPLGEEAAELKLNIADGTYDPATAEQEEEDRTSEKSEAETVAAEESTADESIETTADSEENAEAETENSVEPVRQPVEPKKPSAESGEDEPSAESEPKAGVIVDMDTAG